MLTFKPHSRAFQVAFSPDGASVATCGYGPVLRVSDASTGHSRWHHDTPDRDRIGLGLAYSPDGTKLAVLDWDEVETFSAVSGELLRTYPGRGYALTFTPESTAVVTGAVRPGLTVFRRNLRSGVAKGVPGVNPYDTMNRYCYSPDGKLFAVHGDREVSLTNAKSGHRYAAEPLTNAQSGVGALVFQPNAQRLIFSDGPRLIVFDYGTRERVAERQHSKKHIQEGAITPDGRFFISVSNDATAVVWETTRWTEVRSFAWEIGPLKSVAVSPDGTRAACASDRGRVVVWDLDL